MIKARSAKSKGNFLEDYFADKLVEKGLDCKARRDNASGAGTREKGDIITSAQVLGRNLGVECKNQETLHIPDWWRQVEELEKLDREPVLVYKIPRRNPRVYLVSIYLETFLDMLVALQDKDDTESNIVENYSYEKKNHLQSLKYLKQSISTLINKYEKEILKEE